jgi:hypothetical protein
LRNSNDKLAIKAHHSREGMVCGREDLTNLDDGHALMEGGGADGDLPSLTQASTTGVNMRIF